MKTKIKLPCTVSIAGKDYKVKWNKKVSGGCFGLGGYTIQINPDVDDLEFYNILFHEIMEVILAERLYRFNKRGSQSDNGDYLFVMTHDQFEKAISDFAYSVKKMLNL